MARETSSLPTPLSPRISTRDVAVGHLLDDGGDAAHLLAVAPDRPILVVAQLLAQLAQLGDQPVLLDRVLDRDVERDLAESLGIVRLDDVVGGAEPHRLDDRRGLVAARQHDDLRLGPRGLQRAQRRQPVEPGHHHVEQDDVGRFDLLHGGEQLVAARVAARFVAAQARGRSGGRRRNPNRRQRWLRNGFFIYLLEATRRLAHRDVCKQRYISPVRRATAFKSCTSTEGLRRTADWERSGNCLPVPRAIQIRPDRRSLLILTIFLSTSALAQRLKWRGRAATASTAARPTRSQRTSGEDSAVMRRQFVITDIRRTGDRGHDVRASASASDEARWARRRPLPCSASVLAFPAIRDEAAMVLVGTALIGLAAAVRRAG